jgi:hypothetical protein
MSSIVYKIVDLKTGAHRIPENAHRMPSLIDLGEHEEIMVEIDGKWQNLPNEPDELTAQHKIIMDIRAYLDAVSDRIDDLEELE